MKTIWAAVVTIEARSPLLVGTGKGDDVRDAVCVMDANGIPTIPGSSIAGVLRSLWGSNREDAVAVFGCKDRESASKPDGAPSRLTVGWAAAHDATDTPVSPLPGVPGDDPVLRFLRAGLQRDHVRLNIRGVVDGHGKFDVSPVPAGSRFTFELLLDAPTPDEIKTLTELLHGPGFRLGAQTRRGLGAVTVQRMVAKTFRLDAWAPYARTSDLARRATLLTKVDPPKVTHAGGKVWTLALTAPLGWRIGGGTADEPDSGQKVKRQRADAEPVQLAPYREAKIVWTTVGGKTTGTVGAPQYVLPGTAIKGSLRHRTAFHLRRSNKAWAGEGGENYPTGDDDGLAGLFGNVADTDASGEGTGRPGCVYIDDVWVDQAVSHAQHHVALDRFSGAPLGGALFSEAVLLSPKLTVLVRAESGTITEIAALRAAITDLCQGRLALGAAGSRGHGYFTGNYQESK